MKKFRLITLAAMVFALVLMLASCGNGPEKFYNMDYKTDARTPTDVQELTDIEGYLYKSTGRYVAHFYNLEGNSVKRKIINLKTGRTVSEHTEEKGIGFSVHTDYSNYAYKIVKTTLEGGDTVYIYDNNGVLLYEGDKAPDAPKHKNIEGADYILFESKLYRIDDNGATVKISDVPKFAETVFSEIEYIFDNYCFDLSTGEVKVYDMSLGLVAKYSAPSYAKSAMAFVLNNENIVIQYMAELPADESKYDIYDDGTKYDLVTEIIDVKSGDAKEVDADYVILSVMPKSLVDRYFKNKSPFVDKYENIASIFRIVDKRLDKTEATLDFVYADNNLKLGNSGKLLQNQAAPGIEKLSDDRYLVALSEGYAVIDAKGKFVKGFSANAENFGGAFYIEDRLYNSNLELIEDFSKYQIKVVSQTDGAKIINLDNGYAIYLIANGKATMLQTLSDGKNVQVTMFGYTIYTSNGTSYKHYNMMGEQLLETQENLYEVLGFEYGGICKANNKYYLFKTNN